jgi:ATP-dependent DNA ligase
VWLEPRLLAEVDYAEIMQGRVRDPVFRALRAARHVAHRTGVNHRATSPSSGFGWSEGVELGGAGAGWSV